MDISHPEGALADFASFKDRSGKYKLEISPNPTKMCSPNNLTLVPGESNEKRRMDDGIDRCESTVSSVDH